MSTSLTILLWLVVSVSPQAEIDRGVAETLILNDGSVLRGLIESKASRGTLRALVRRAWASEHLPRHLTGWEQDERDRARVAMRQSWERLQAWKRERTAANGANQHDPIDSWIARELASLEHAETRASPLILVELDLASVRRVIRKDESSRRVLRQGWRAGFEDVETMPAEELRARLEARGFALNGTDPARIDDLMGRIPEPESTWIARRAATEVKNDTRTRFVRYGPLVLPEDASGIRGESVTRLAESLLGQILGESTPPLANSTSEPFDLVRKAGLRGLVVSELVIAPDQSAVTVIATFWVLDGSGRWVEQSRHPARVRTGSIEADAIQGLAADPTIEQAFRVFETLGLVRSDDATHLTSLRIGAATRQALGIAQTSLRVNLDALAIPIQD